MVILDDRPNQEKAREEAVVLSQFADVMMITSLQNKIRDINLAS